MVAIYCRTSKNKKEGVDKSIPSQKNLGVEFAEKMNWNYQLFIDEGISGAGENIKDRPSFTLLLDAIRKKRIDAVYCIDQSRIERNSSVWNFFAAVCIESKCNYYPAGVLFDLTVPENKLFAGLLSLTNSFFSEITSRKVKIANELKVKEGKTHGITPYGYGRDPDTGLYVINKDEGEIVKRIYQLSLEGVGVYSIANVLNKEGIPTKFHRYQGKFKRIDKFTNIEKTFNKNKVVWRGNVIHDMIRNPIYRGVRRWNNIEAKAPAIIDEELWSRVNNNLEHNKKNVGRKEYYSYLLNGLLYCSHCGMDIRGKMKMKGKSKTYKCKSKDTPNLTCDLSRGINIPKFETFVISHLFEHKALRDFLVNYPREKDLEDKLEAEIKKNTDELSKIINKIEHLYRLLTDPDWANDDRIKDELISAKKKKTLIENAIKTYEIKLNQHNTNIRSERARNIIDNFNLDMGFESIKKSVHELIERITVHHTKKEKSGYFLFNIKYRGFEEESIFYTDWQAVKWYWMSHYRKQAISDETLAEDKEFAKYLLNESGYSKMKNGFDGFETTTGKHDIITLKSEELIEF